ncbi:unnamed protein product, partial [marine sediment metagenome]
MNKFFSYSALKLYGFEGDESEYSCRYAYFLQYEKRLKSKATDSRRFLVGGVCHNCFERWAKEGDYKRGWMRSIFTVEWERYIKKNPVLFLSSTDEGMLQNRCTEYLTSIEEGYFSLGLDRTSVEIEYVIKVWIPGWQTFLYARADFFDRKNSDVYDMKASKIKRYFDLRQGLFEAALLLLK